ncbi:SDR family oxidoreductase [Streptomyces sp. GTA36]
MLAEKIGPSVTYVHLDVTDRDDWDAAVGTAVNSYGGLDVLVNNAGISIPGPIDVHEQAAWDKVIAVNLTGVFKSIQAAVPALKSSGRGSIINVSSVAGLVGVPVSPGYVATKFGVRGLTKAAALDLGKYGIRVNSVHPGFINTPLVVGLPVDAHDLALGRGGEPEEVAKLVVFLASDESSFSTGAEFTADGGETAGAVSGGSLSAVLSGPPGDDQSADKDRTAENKALVVDFYDQLFNHGNLAVVDAVVRSDLIQHSPQLPDGSHDGRVARGNRTPGLPQNRA